MNKKFYDKLEKYQDGFLCISLTRWLFLLLTIFSLFFGFSLTYPIATLIIFFIHYIFNMNYKINRYGYILYRRVYMKELY